MSQIEWCENTLCESEAFKRVEVSENKPGDSTRDFCAVCEEAYTIGVQHGRMALRELVERIARMKTDEEDEWEDGGEVLIALDGLIADARKLTGIKPEKEE